MSAYRRMSDVVPRGAEGRFMTRLGPSADSGLTPRQPLPSLADGLYGSMSERLTAPGTWNAIPPLINAARVALDSALVTDQPATRPEA